MLARIYIIGKCVLAVVTASFLLKNLYLDPFLPYLTLFVLSISFYKIFLVTAYCL